MAVGDVYKASALFSGPGADNPMVCTFHYQANIISGGPTPAQEAQQVAQALVLELIGSYTTLLTQNTTLIEVTVIGISEPTATFTEAIGQQGDFDEEVGSWRTAPVASWKSGVRGRSFNGRSYLIAPPESQIADGVMIPNYIIALDTAMNDIATLVAPSLNEYIIGTYSRTLAQFTPSVNVVIRSSPGTQRSRMKVT